MEICRRETKRTMLIRITNRCHMGCSHCLVDARPDGDHMPLNVYAKALDFASATDGIVLLSGGEPTEHPDILNYLRLAKAAVPASNVAMLSNGAFLRDSRELLKEGILIQVTNDNRYYPERVPYIDHENLCYTFEVPTLIKLGRGRENIGRHGPGCYNFRRAVLVTRNLSRAITLLRASAKFCSPSIGVDGTLRAGETPECFPFGTIWTRHYRLVQQLRRFDCDRCGLHDSLTPDRRGALSLSR